MKKENQIRNKMKRYHKKIYFPSQYDSQLKELTTQFNSTRIFNKSNHAIYQLKTRFDFLNILQFLKDMVYFKQGNIFEYYIKNDNIAKICYKIRYNEGQDLIIVLSDKKSIITLYINNKGDNHKTLKKELYCIN